MWPNAFRSAWQSLLYSSEQQSSTLPNSVDMPGCVYAGTVSHSYCEAFTHARQAWPGIAHHYIKPSRPCLL
jgi:hypothetical protein